MTTKHIFVFHPYSGDTGDIITQRDGQPCIAIEDVTSDQDMPMTRVKFEDGFTLAAFRDELVPLDVEAQRRADRVY